MILVTSIKSELKFNLKVRIRILSATEYKQKVWDCPPAKISVPSGENAIHVKDLNY